MEHWLELPSPAFALRPHHALRVLTTSVLPERCLQHRRRSRASRVLDTLAMKQIKCSTCPSSVDAHTAGSSVVLSRLPFAPDVRGVLSSVDTLSLHEGPRTRRLSSTLACSA